MEFQIGKQDLEDLVIITKSNKGLRDLSPLQLRTDVMHSFYFTFYQNFEEKKGQFNCSELESIIFFIFQIMIRTEMLVNTATKRIRWSFLKRNTRLFAFGLSQYPVQL